MAEAKWQLEENTDLWQLEESTDVWVLEEHVPVAKFPGTTAGDGGHIWPPRSNDPRWAQFITDSGISATGNFVDDVHQALEAMLSTTGDLNTLWKKVLADNSVTDTSEPYLY